MSRSGPFRMLALSTPRRRQIGQRSRVKFLQPPPGPRGWSPGLSEAPRRRVYSRPSDDKPEIPTTSSASRPVVIASANGLKAPKPAYGRLINERRPARRRHRRRQLVEDDPEGRQRRLRRPAQRGWHGRARRRRHARPHAQGGAVARSQNIKNPTPGRARWSWSAPTTSHRRRGRLRLRQAPTASRRKTCSPTSPRKHGSSGRRTSATTTTGCHPTKPAKASSNIALRRNHPRRAPPRLRSRVDTSRPPTHTGAPSTASPSTPTATSRRAPPPAASPTRSPAASATRPSSAPGSTSTTRSAPPAPPAAAKPTSQNCTSFLVVELMRHGQRPAIRLPRGTPVHGSPAEPRLLNKDGKPPFDVKMYALAKDGRHGSASIWSGATTPSATPPARAWSTPPSSSRRHERTKRSCGAHVAPVINRCAPLLSSSENVSVPLLSSSANVSVRT